MNPVVSYLKFVEITTKIASFMPFFIGAAYCYHVSGRLNGRCTLVFCLAMFLFDMGVTAINNYFDKRRSGENPHFSDKASLGIIAFLTLTSAGIGIYLTSVFGMLLLAAGAACFFFGIFYTAGPISISRTPYGEIFSGPVQGLLIPFILVVINLPKGYVMAVDLDFATLTLTGSVNIGNALRFVLACMPAGICISNLMLANNICDVERDAKSKRYTLPYYIGREKACLLFKFLYAAVYGSIAAAWAIGAIPWICLLNLAACPLVMKNASAFTKNPVKSETFLFNLKNFVIILAPYAVTILAGGIFARLDR
jgi:1,4-dihydroxy-2-naphthoate octaprenyltransferase